MAISSITTQPSSGSIHAAYRPVILVVRATATDGGPRPPVVYCDIYFGGVFYKTLSKTQYSLLTETYSEFTFDIQDAGQEYLQKYLGPNGGSAIITTSGLMASVVCKFRSSGMDADGFIAPEGTVPIQGTSNSDPVAGTGTSSNTFLLINAVLQHEDNQDMLQHLNVYKSGEWQSSAFPLTHRPTCPVTQNDSDYFPLILASSVNASGLRLKYKFRGQTTVRSDFASITQTYAAGAYYLPFGPLNIASLFPMIKWKDLAEYYLELVDESNAVVATTTSLIIGAPCEDHVRLHFLNSLGSIDAINFCISTIEHEAKSETYEQPTSYPLVRSKHAINRFNVKANKTYMAKTVEYSEDAMEWMAELLESPAVWTEWSGTQGQDPSYLPVVLVDQKTFERKEADRFMYEVQVQFKLSHERFIIRN